MRVLFVTHSYPRFAGDVAGGFILRLATALQASGTEVRVLAPAGPGLAPRDDVGGIPLTRFHYAPAAWETLAYEGTMAEQVRASWHAKLALGGMLLGIRSATLAAMRDFRPDVIHAHWWFPSGLSLRFSRRAEPLVVTLHGSDVRLAVRSAPAQLAFRTVARRARVVTAVSRWLATTADAFGSGRSVRVAPMPVDVDLFPFHGGQRERRVLLVGRLNAQKGVADLLDAIALVAPDVGLDVVGDGPDGAALVARAESLGVAPRVRWLGAVPQAELGPLYRAAAAVVIPSRDEGLGLVAVEAQLSGAPVIAYRSGGLTDVVNELTGTLVAPGDIPALAAAITETVNRSATMVSNHSGSAQARENMLARFSPAAAAGAYAAIYREITGQ